MPYEKLADLPDSVRDNLPKHAQEIYRAAYNSAEEQYDEEDRRHRVAWSAVEQKYEKDEDSAEWISFLSTLSTSVRLVRSSKRC